MFLGYLSLGSNFFPTHYDSSTFITNYLVERALPNPNALLNNLGFSLSHIFQEPLYYYVGKCLALFNYHGRMLVPLKIVNFAFAALAVLFFYLVLLRLTKEPISAFLSSAFLGFGYGFWYWSGQTYCYDISFFFIFLSLYLYLHFPGITGILLAGVSSSLAAGFATLSLPFVAVMILLILCSPETIRTRLLFLSIYILTTFVSFLFFLCCFLANSISLNFIFLWTTQFFQRAYGTFLHTHQNLSLISSSQEYFIKSGLLRIFKWNLLPGWLEMSCPEGSIIYDRALATIKLNEILNRIILGGILLIVSLSLIRFRRLWASKKTIILISFAWTVFFGFSFLVVDPNNYFINLTFAGVIFLICASGSVSKANRIILAAALLILFAGNFHQVLRGHTQDPLLKASGQISGFVKTGDFCLVRDPEDTEWALMYCYMLDLLPIGDQEAQALLQGRLSGGLTGIISSILAADRTVFFNVTRFEHNMEFRGFTAAPGWWKILKKTFNVSKIFVFPNYLHSCTKLLPSPAMSLEDLIAKGGFNDEIVYETYLAIRSR